MDALMRPTNLRTAAQFDKATEIMQTLLSSTSADEMGEAMEAAASDADLAQAVIFRLTVVARGWADEQTQQTGVEMVSAALAGDGKLVLP